MSSYHLEPGDQITIGSPESPAPSDIQTFLTGRGWNTVGTRFQHNAKDRWHMTWEQAVAIEFYEFITIGGVR